MVQMIDLWGRRRRNTSGMGIARATTKHDTVSDLREAADSGGGTHLEYDYVCVIGVDMNLLRLGRQQVRLRALRRLQRRHVQVLRVRRKDVGRRAPVRDAADRLLRGEVQVLGLCRRGMLRAQTPAAYRAVISA